MPDIGQLTAQASRIATDIGTVAARVQSAFDSEAWMDANEARSLFNRENYSSLLLRPVDENR